MVEALLCRTPTQSRRRAALDQRAHVPVLCRCEGAAHPRADQRGAEALQVPRGVGGPLRGEGWLYNRTSAVVTAALDTQLPCPHIQVANRGLCAVAQAESMRYKLLGGLAVRRACYGVLRFVMESGKPLGTRGHLCMVKNTSVLTLVYSQVPRAARSLCRASCAHSVRRA